MSMWHDDEEHVAEQSRVKAGTNKALFLLYANDICLEFHDVFTDTKLLEKLSSPRNVHISVGSEAGSSRKQALT